MMSDSDHKGYRPVQKTEDSGPRDVTEHDDDRDARKDSNALPPEERCLCGALQRLASPYVFGACVCLLNFLQAAAFTATGSAVLTTIEKRFQLRTSQLAPFLIVNDTMSVIMVLFVAYFGHASHRPRLVGGGSFLTGLGLLLCMLPQFIYEAPPQFSLDIGRSEVNLTADGISQDGNSVIYPVCYPNATTDSDGTEVCTEEDQATSGSLLWQASWIIIGQILTGVGTAPIMPLSVTYMDDSLQKTSTSVYIACMFISGSFGPLLGAVIGGFSLSRHADFYKASSVDSRPGDPNWIGAWWLTFVISGVLLILVAIPIAMFPKRIPKRGSPVRRGEGKEIEAGPDGENEGRDVAGMYRLDVHKRGQGRCAYGKGFLKAILRLVTNVTFMTLILGVCALLLTVGGHIFFMAKYLETQFDLPASSASMLFGVIMAPGSLLGNLIGGFVVKKMKLTQKGMARMLVILKPVFYILAPLFLFIGCSNREIAGLNVKYPAMNVTSDRLPDLVAGCNADCACPTEYTPVCGSDGVTYATPCHAGCLATVEDMSINDGEGTMYTDCGCIGPTSESNSFILNGDYDHVAIEGQCPRPCNALIPFIAIAMIDVLLGSIVGNPGFMLQLRAVDDDDRSIAVGFTSMLLRLLGFIPSPIIFGGVIQMTCLLLQSSCGKTGNCQVYDIVKFRYAFYGLTIGTDLLAMLMFGLCYLSIKEAKRPEGFETIPAVTEAANGVDIERNKESCV